jgi:hypothetical protein
MIASSESRAGKPLSQRMKRPARCMASAISGLCSQAGNGPLMPERAPEPMFIADLALARRSWSRG